MITANLLRPCRYFISLDREKVNRPPYTDFEIDDKIDPIFLVLSDDISADKKHDREIDLFTVGD